MPRLLLVEDNEMNRDMLARRLERRGYQVVVAVDGGWPEGREDADARRDAALGRLGYRVLRLPAEMVERQVKVAVARVRDALGGG